jgi:hypothetical protein
VIAVMAELPVVEKKGNCNVVGGPTGSGSYATAMQTAALVPAEIYLLNPWLVSGSVLVPAMPQGLLRPVPIGTNFALLGRCNFHHLGSPLHCSSAICEGTMTGPGLIGSRRFTSSTKLRLQLVFARASEALAETYQAQAAEFVRRLKSRLAVDEALQRYFHEVAVPTALEETVRARALISLAGLIESPPQHESRSPGWTVLRPDQMLDAFRKRVQHVEETNLECRLAGSMSDEAVAATHVRMALETAEILADEVTPDEAIMHYVRTFNLTSLDAQVIYRSAMAQWAELHPLPGEARAILAQSNVHPSLEIRSRPEFGLRVIV